ncbi:MAG: class I SAM-dependent methyltransferase, partial [Armatimonadota bacterium]|nr:class I SAM-dependent methyltransferase [Armatimonadota bacterium]
MNIFGRAFWNFYATCYDTIAQLIPYREMLNRVIEALAPTEGSRMLDAGCGTGNLEMRLLSQPLELQVEAVDFSAVMIAHAGRKHRLFIARMIQVERRTKAPTVRFSCRDLDEPLPYEDQLFDIVTSINCLYS